MTFKLPEPGTLYYRHGEELKYYTEAQLTQAVKDVLEQVALKVESQWYAGEDGVRKAVVEIRKMKDAIE